MVRGKIFQVRPGQGLSANRRHGPIRVSRNSSPVPSTFQLLLVEVSLQRPFSVRLTIDPVS